MSGTVHVLLGDTAAGTFAASRAGDGGGVLTLRDALSCGPLVPIADVRSWERLRSAYWEGLGFPVELGFVSGDAAALAVADRIVLWIGTALGEQVTLAWLPAWLRAIGADPARLEVVQFHRDGEGEEILGLGALHPDQIAAHPTAVRLSVPDLAELDVAWRAVTAPEPDALMAYLASPRERLPLLERALRSLLSRYPDAVSGVSAKEMRLLRRAKEVGPRAVLVLAHVIADCFEAVGQEPDGMDQVGDGWLFARMLRLADPALREPALEITGSREIYRDARVRLTELGQRLLDGRANFVEVNGIDDWVAGVHLDSAAGRVWFQRGGELVPAQRLA
jgi:hypothetical protein